jgi:hypothetical protein
VVCLGFLILAVLGVLGSGGDYGGDDEMTQWKLGACPKCNGDIYRRDDQYGTYVSCLQCGAIPVEARPAPAKRHGPRPMEDLPQVEDGCELAHSCFACPLPACKYEYPYRRPEVVLRRPQLRAAVEEELAGGRAATEAVAEVARRYHLAERTVYRAWRGRR